MVKLEFENKPPSKEALEESQKAATRRLQDSDNKKSSSKKTSRSGDGSFAKQPVSESDPAKKISSLETPSEPSKPSTSSVSEQQSVSLQQRRQQIAQDRKVSTREGVVSKPSTNFLSTADKMSGFSQAPSSEGFIKETSFAKTPVAPSSTVSQGFVPFGDPNPPSRIEVAENPIFESSVERKGTESLSKLFTQQTTEPFTIQELPASLFVFQKDVAKGFGQEALNLVSGKTPSQASGFILESSSDILTGKQTPSNLLTDTTSNIIESTSRSFRETPGKLAGQVLFDVAIDKFFSRGVPSAKKSLWRRELDRDFRSKVTDPAFKLPPKKTDVVSLVEEGIDSPRREVLLKKEEFSEGFLPSVDDLGRVTELQSQLIPDTNVRVTDKGVADIRTSPELSTSDLLQQQTKLTSVEIKKNIFELEKPSSSLKRNVPVTEIDTNTIFVKNGVNEIPTSGFFDIKNKRIYVAGKNTKLDVTDAVSHERGHAFQDLVEIDFPDSSEIAKRELKLLQEKKLVEGDDFFKSYSEDVVSSEKFAEAFKAREVNPVEFSKTAPALDEFFATLDKPSKVKIQPTSKSSVVDSSVQSSLGAFDVVEKPSKPRVVSSDTISGLKVERTGKKLFSFPDPVSGLVGTATDPDFLAFTSKEFDRAKTAVNRLRSDIETPVTPASRTPDTVFSPKTPLFSANNKEIINNRFSDSVIDRDFSTVETPSTKPSVAESLSSGRSLTPDNVVVQSVTPVISMDQPLPQDKGSRSKSSTAQDTSLSSSLDTVNRQKVIPQKTVPKTVSKPFSSLRRLREPLRIVPNIDRNSSRRQPLSEVFRVTVGRQGAQTFKTFEVGSLADALRIGKRGVVNTAAASLKIEPVGRSLKEDEKRLLTSFLGKKFRPSKSDKNIFVQKREFRISSPGEKKDITQKGLLSLKTSKGSKKAFSLLDQGVPLRNIRRLL